MPRGHSNIRIEEIKRHENREIDAAMIPIEGGASVYTVRPLPPLALRREEWETIALKMGWLSDIEVALKDICQYPTLGKVKATGINRVRNYTFTPEQLRKARAALEKTERLS